MAASTAMDFRARCLRICLMRPAFRCITLSCVLRGLSGDLTTDSDDALAGQSRLEV